MTIELQIFNLVNGRPMSVKVTEFSLDVAYKQKTATTIRRENYLLTSKVICLLKHSFRVN